MPLTLRPTGLSSPAYRDQLLVRTARRSVACMTIAGAESRSPRRLGARPATPYPLPNTFSRRRTEHEQTCFHFTALISIRLRPLGLLLDDT
jgi:hypothetical protein